MRRGSACAAGVALGGLLVACASPPALLLAGDANSARIAYSGALASATAVAERHCARYERVPRLQMADMDTAYFACVKP
ncbi:MAG TPA: hypothetical protein VE993_09100 [Stellaceae bacterium]|nr:hypothetical protein [Stellaceae bacterium]